MARHKVRNVFLPPTALKLMRQAGVDAAASGVRTHRPRGGETLGGELLDWGRATFGVTINEFYGQTECNVVVANCAGCHAGAARIDGPRHARPSRRGDSTKRARACRPACRAHCGQRPDPVMFLGYWNNPEATAAKFIGDWLLTGDTGPRRTRTATSGMSAAMTT